MISFTVAQTIPKDIEKKVATAITSVIAEVSAFAQAVAKKNAPADIGNLVNSIFTIPPTPPKFKGGIQTNVPYALVMEDGRRPGRFPPVDAMIAWVTRKRKDFGIKKSEIPSVAFLVGRAISRRGITGRKFFDKALKITTAKLPDFSRKLGIKIKGVWDSGG